MTTGETIAVVGGVVVVAGLAFIVLRKPALVTAKAVPKPTSSAGSLIATLGGSLVSRLGNDAINGLESTFSDWVS